MSLPDSTLIRDKAEAKLESLQLEAFSLRHTIETSYLDLRRILGSREADEFIVDLIKLPF